MVLFIFKIGLILLAIALFSGLINVLKSLYRLKNLLDRSQTQREEKPSKVVEAEYRILKD